MGSRLAQLAVLMMTKSGSLYYIELHPLLEERSKRPKYVFYVPRMGKSSAFRILLSTIPRALREQIIFLWSFEQRVQTLPELGESIASYMSIAAEKLRRGNAVCEAIQVFAQTNPFREQNPQYSNNITIPLPNASCNTRYWYKPPYLVSSASIS